MRLLDQSDYIKSCLIGFYLNNMRIQNFKLIMKCHNNEQFKCEFLDDTLRFNDSEEFLGVFIFNLVDFLES
jgi:hypothetical protein